MKNVDNGAPWVLYLFAELGLAPHAYVYFDPSSVENASSVGV